MTTPDSLKTADTTFVTQKHMGLCCGCGYSEESHEVPPGTEVTVISLPVKGDNMPLACIMIDGVKHMTWSFFLEEHGYYIGREPVPAY